MHCKNHALKAAYKEKMEFLLGRLSKNEIWEQKRQDMKHNEAFKKYFEDNVDAIRKAGIAWVEMSNKESSERT